MNLVNNALTYNAKASEDYTREAVEITGLENPNSIPQLKKWLEEQTGNKQET